MTSCHHKWCHALTPHTGLKPSLRTLDYIQKAPSPYEIEERLTLQPEGDSQRQPAKKPPTGAEPEQSPCGWWSAQMESGRFIRNIELDFKMKHRVLFHANAFILYFAGSKESLTFVLFVLIVFIFQL
jgi:hypothetical protein